MQKEIKRLNAVEPLEYARGFTEFGVPPGSCKIDLSKKPLIPRSETEFWVKKAISQIKNKKNLRVLDIFAGSGCIGLAVLKNIKGCEVIFADSEKNAISQIKINLKLNRLIRTNKAFTEKNRCVVVRSDVFSNIKGKYDIIFANPPYVAIKNKSMIQKSVLDFEPHQALFAGQDGLFYINKFLNQAKNYLKPNGIIFMEFSPEQKKEIEKILKKLTYKKREFYKDQYNKYRWVVVF